MRRLLPLNVTLALASLSLLAYIGWQVARPAPDSVSVRRPLPAATSAGSPAVLAAAEGPPATWTSIAARNLFSPTRSEAPAAGAPAAGGAPSLPRPHLYGVVLREGASVAYLEDPVTKRVAGYRVGDAIAGGTVQSIAADRVVLMRPDGSLDVRLHDPAKPRPAAAPPPAEGDGAMPPTAPVQRPPLGPGAVPTPAVGPPPPVSGFGPPEPPVIPPTRRPLPPNLLRRVPPTLSDAPHQ
jgi:hypothetical protein